MRVFIAIVVLAALVTAAAPHNYRVMFEEFKAKQGRSYASPAEEAQRFKNFVANMKEAARVQARNPLATFGANLFSDWSAAELAKHRGSRKTGEALAKRNAQLPTVRFSEAEVKAAANEKVDWRPKGAVTAVKNQADCGDCWAFSTTGGIEGQWFLAGNTLTSLSEQELTACDTTNDGCDGGWMSTAIEWLLSAHAGGIATEASYPFASASGTSPPCDMSGAVVGATVDGWKAIAKDEAQMAAFVAATGPLSIAVYAEPWQSYISGIMTDCSDKEGIDHGVLIVGYDLTNSPPYWIIKNSWSATWGEEGYIRVEYGKNLCYITYGPVTSTVKGGPGPGPGPAPSGDFVQKTCTDAKCQNCTSDSLPQNQCIKGDAGDSFKASCITDGLLVQAFATADCSGAYTQGVSPINQCNIVFKKQSAFKWVENICGAGPGPTPPTPTTTAAPSGGSLIQEICNDAACTQGCQNNSFPLNTCLALSGGGSAMATCTTSSVTLTEYLTSSTCTGPSIPDNMATGQCVQDTSGSYLENFCVLSSTAARTPAAFAKKLRSARKH